MTLATVMRTRRLRWISLALTALVTGALGGLTVLWVNGGADNPVVGWFGDWLQSPGFTGLGAIVAASIAFIGISLQLNANRERDADAAWWQSFEWASDRGLPRNPSELGLSFEAALDTLNALATAARTDIQKNAVRGVVDELIRSHGSRARDEVSTAPDTGVAPNTQDAEQSVPESPDGLENALPDVDSDADGSASAVLRYVLQQVGTAAESRRANAAAYEAEVLKALRHIYGNVLSMPGVMAGDAIVTTRSRQVVVEIKWSPNPILNLNSRASMGSIDVVISNAHVANLPPDVEQVVWNPRDGSFALRQALDAIG